MINNINMDKKKITIISVVILVVILAIIAVCYLAGINPFFGFGDKSTTTTTVTTKAYVNTVQTLPPGVNEPNYVEAPPAPSF